MKTIFLLAAVLAFAGYIHAAKVQLAASVNGDKSITYTVGTSKLTVSTIVAALLATPGATFTQLLNSAVQAAKTGITIDMSLNDDGSYTFGSGQTAIDFPASVVNQFRNVVVFIYKTISSAAQQKNIVGLY